MLVGSLKIPDSSEGLLCDLDGTLLDTLGLDLRVCNTILSNRFGSPITLSHELIRQHFALDPRAFWVELLSHVERNHGVSPDDGSALAAILAEYERCRTEASFASCEGVDQLLADAKKLGLPIAIVSNNPVADIERILEQSGISHAFDVIVGNDGPGMRRKPEPDTYLFAASELGIDVRKSVVLEDSVIGVAAGRAAGAFVVGVATGGASFDVLVNSQRADVVYESFAPYTLDVTRGSPHLSVRTPSKAIDDVLASMARQWGVGGIVEWRNDDWIWLGELLGRALEAAGATRTADSAPREHAEQAVVRLYRGLGNAGRF